MKRAEIVKALDRFPMGAPMDTEIGRRNGWELADALSEARTALEHYRDGLPWWSRLLSWAVGKVIEVLDAMINELIRRLEEEGSA